MDPPRFRGAMGGLTPTEPSPRLYFAPPGHPSLWLPWEPYPLISVRPTDRWLGQPPAGGGGIHSRGGSQGIVSPLGCLPRVLPWMAPLILGLLGFARIFLDLLGFTGILPVFTDFSDFLGRIFLQDCYFTLTTVFFPGVVLRRNEMIKEVVLVEASSILPLPS